MNWILILICLMFLAVLAGPASADTVTALVPATLVANPTLCIAYAVIIICVLAFIGLLWYASGYDRAKIKAELLHTPQKATEPPSVSQQLLDASQRVYEIREGEFSTFGAANEYAKKQEPTWSIREVYFAGVVKWRLYKWSYQVKACRGRPFWHVSSYPHPWGEPDGYNTQADAKVALEQFVKTAKEVEKPREVLNFNRDGDPIGEPLKV